MTAKKKQARGLEEVSHFFLSRQDPSQSKENNGKGAQAHAVEIPSLPKDTARGSSLFFFSSSSLFAEKSFLACNLAIELARRNISVGLIETTTRVPNTFFLLGSLFPESTRHENTPSMNKNSPTGPQRAPTPEPLKLFDISVGSPKNIKAVFWENNVDSPDSSSALHTLFSESEFLIINATPDILKLRELTYLMNDFFIILTTVRSEQLLNAYLLIKQISSCVGRGEIALTVMDEGFSQDTDAAYRIITDMANKFLSCKVRSAGTIPKGAEFFRSILNRTPLLMNEETSPISQSIRKLADSVLQKEPPI